MISRSNVQHLLLQTLDPMNGQLLVPRDCVFPRSNEERSWIHPFYCLPQGTLGLGDPPPLPHPPPTPPPPPHPPPTNPPTFDSREFTSLLSASPLSGELPQRCCFRAVAGVQDAKTRPLLNPLKFSLHKPVPPPAIRAGGVADFSFGLLRQDGI